MRVADQGDGQADRVAPPPTDRGVVGRSGLQAAAPWLALAAFAAIPLLHAPGNGGIAVLLAALGGALATFWLATLGVHGGAARAEVDSALERAGALLEDRERQLRALLEQAPFGVGVLDEHGAWLEANERLGELCDRPRAELLQLDLAASLPAEARPAAAAFARQLLAGETERCALELRRPRADGSTASTQLQLARVAGTPARLLAFVEDLGERRRLEHEVEAHRRARDFHFDNTPLAAIEWTPELCVRRWSRQAERMFGWSEGEVLGRSLGDWQFVHEDDRAATGRFIRELLSGAETAGGRLNRNYRKDGSVIWCEWYSSVLHDEAGTVSSYLTVANDVTSRQQTLQALHESESQLRGFFEQAAVGIAVLDEHGRWLSVNRRLCDLLGYGREELLRLDQEMLTHPDDLPAANALLARLYRGEIPNFTLEQRYLRKDASAVWITLYLRRIEATGTTPMRCAAVIEDISERKHAEAAAQRINADLERKVSERTRQLQETTRRWGERNRELSLLAEMMGVLPAARDTGEANLIVARFLPRLFNRYGGEVWIEEQLRGRYSRVAHWNVEAPGPATVAVDDCWALRRGQPLRIDDPRDPLICPHCRVEPGLQPPRCCMPILALGEVVGLIHLRWTVPGAEAGPPDPMLLASTAEQIGLAIGNVRLREELRQQALRDPLTGLYNRRHLEDSLLRRVAECRRNGRAFALLMIDIDHFKAINDGHGHDAGDEVLRVIGALLQAAVRADESVFRLGGEEFVMLLNDTGGEDMGGAAERLRAAVEALRVDFGGEQLPPVTVSIGAAHFPNDTADLSALIGRADQALYAAKRGGRNRVCYARDETGPMPGGLALLELRERTRSRPRELPSAWPGAG